MAIQNTDLVFIQDGENVKDDVLNRPSLNLQQEVNNFNFYNTTTTSTSKTLEVGEQCMVTQDGITVSLPASPKINNEVCISVGDFKGVIVGRNGNNIMGLAEDMTMNIDYGSVTLVYTNATEGWRIKR